MLMRQGMGGQVPDLSSRARERYIRSIPVDLIWLVRIAGVIAHCAKNETSLFGEGDRVSKILEKDFKLQTFDEHYNTIDTSDDDAIVVAVDDARKARSEICNQFTKIYTEWCPDNEQPDEYFLWQATMNRKVELAGDDSSLTVKADAGRRLFDFSCKKITWAVIDSGIDGNHPAFKNTSEEHEAEKLAQSDVPLDQDAGYTGVRIEDLESRVIKTIDFTDLRDLLDPDVLDPAVHETNDRRDQLIDSLARRMPDNGQSADGTGGDPRKAAEDALNELNLRIKGGHDIDWEALEPLIEDIKPKTPRNDHGTHVAGILAADWIDDDEEFTNFPLKQRPRRMQGVCPDIRLMDVRVFREQGDTEEFELLAAVQFLRWLNSRAGFMTVHGSNLSLSLVHEVRRFACGQTPICIECNEAAALGMVMVSAAGNRGYESEDLHMAGGRKGFRAISITDPGNAEQVITVGATHRKRPHDYGVSYFSSRGPTGDGRVKPDLVAPGEKIKGPAPNGGAEYKDGTSMAAPHVSGAAAMLMARHSELIGKPQRIKEILCDTATDLGRDPYFQGRGLVDILRALQSV
jgi:subtilisin family serine protease